MDKLQKSAKALSSLLDIEYRIVIGRKGIAKKLKITFHSIHFHHLIGLHKLKDLRIARADRKSMFQNALGNKLNYIELEKSVYFHEIQKRVEFFEAIQDILDDNKEVYHFNKMKLASQIEAKYLLSTTYNGQTIYLFLDQKESEEYFCRSFFLKENNDYTKGQARYQLLYKEKYNKTTKESKVIFRHNNYQITKQEW